MSTDRIEKKIFLRATRERVWRAISDSKEFGEWFGIQAEGPFKAGATMRAAIVGTKVNDEVAAAQKKHSGIPFELVIDKIEPQRLFSFRWHPHAIDPKKDYSHEPTTLVVFELSEAPGGTLLKVTESGFDGVPIERRQTAYRGNSEGWAIQVGNFERYVVQHP